MNSRVMVGTVLLITLSLAALPALAETTPSAAPKAAEVLRQADTNGDGKVTYEELKALRPKLTPERFKELDRNDDGVISGADRKGPPAEGRDTKDAGRVSWLHRLSKLKEADSDGDGKVTLEEARMAFPNLSEEQYRKLDHNGDGVLTREDLRQAAAGKFKQADKNEDGKVSLEEAQAAFPQITPERFRRLDRNGDGFLTPEDRNF